MTKGMVLVQTGLILCVMLAGCKKEVSQRATRTKANLKYLHSAVKTFKMDTGRYPTDAEGLTVLAENPGDKGWEPGGYLETIELPKDGWRNDFIYQLTPAGDEPFVIKSLGADGKPGGSGINADLSSTDVN